MKYRIGISLAIALIAGAFAFTTRASAFTSTQATNIWNAYNNAFYVGNTGDAYYRQDQGGGQDIGDFWYNAEELEMADDRAARSGSAGDKTIVAALVNGFDATYGSDWTGDMYNDDVMWACLAHLRAYFVTGSTNTNWAVEAADNFNWVYNGGHSPGRSAPQVDGTYGGGMWWTTDHSSTGTKNACDNGPAALVAYYLSTIWPSGTGFLSQSQSLYNWEKSTLVTSSGYVYDHTGSSGVTGYDLSYNAGAFIGAAYLLGDSGEAQLAATYFMNSVDGGQNGILPAYGSGGGNDDGFSGIFFRWMALYMNGSGTQSIYGEWLYNNAAAALNVANSADLSWNTWTSSTPSSGLYSWDCSSSVVALQVLAPSGITNGVHTLTPACATGSRLDDYGAGTGNGNKIDIWQSNGTQAQNWSFAAISQNGYNLAVNLGPYCLDGGAAQVGTPTQIWGCNGTADQLWNGIPVSGGYEFVSGQSDLCVDVSGAGSANGTTVQSWSCNGSNAQIWAVN